MPTAAVVVIGDVGRSPRTANHALSLAEEKGYHVCLIGYAECALNERIANHERISVIPLRAPPSFPLPELVCLPLRFLWTAFTLLFALTFRVGWSLNIILVQNPPALPALMVAWLVSVIRDARFVIDWHNYTWSMLGERWKMTENELGLEMYMDSMEVKKEKTFRRIGGGRAKYIRLTHYLEGLLGRAADASLCVSAAMADDLKKRWAVEATVFYDRPPKWKFGTVSLAAKHSLFRSLREKADEEGNMKIADALSGERKRGDTRDTFFTRENSSGEVSLRDDRPLIVISSTSWTPDEDFSILFDAIVKYDERVELEKERSLPRLFLIITGKGPEKEYYMDKIDRLSLSHVSIYSPWLEAADYPTAVATADLGVCLHTSTSGVDLPMKVVDMFGCGVPVLAKRFPAIGELVKENENGHLFDTPDDLANLLIKMASGHPTRNEKLHKLHAHVTSSNGRLKSWEETWGETTRETFRDEKDEIFRAVISN